MPNKTLGRTSFGAQTAYKRPVPPSGQGRGSIIAATEVSPATIASALTSAASGNLADLQGLYRRMQISDARVRMAVQTLKSALMASPLRVFKSPLAGKGGSADAEAAAALARSMVAGLSRTRTTGPLVQPYLTCVSVFQPIWQPVTGESGDVLLLPTALEEVSPVRLRMDTTADSKTYGEIMVATEKEPRGVPVSSFKPGELLLVTDDTQPGFYDTGGAFRSCLFWWLVKAKNGAWWAEFNELYAHPHVMAFYDEGASSDEQDDLLAYVQGLQRNAYGLFPKSVDLDYVETARAGQVKTYEDLIGLANTEITLAILGQTQTSDGGDQGSYKKAQVHNTIRYEIIRAIATQVEEALEHLLRDAIAFNISPDFDPALVPQIRLVVPNPEEKESKVRVFAGFQALGGQLSDRFVRDELGISPIEEGEEILQPILPVAPAQVGASDTLVDGQ